MYNYLWNLANSFEGKFSIFSPDGKSQRRLRNSKYPKHKTMLG
jgi:hypothetical protein